MTLLSPALWYLSGDGLQSTRLQILEWMVVFGLGTVPMVGTIMIGSMPVAQAMRKKEMRIALECTLVLLGLWTIFGGHLMMAGQEGNKSHHHH